MILPHARRESTCCAKRSQHRTGSICGCASVPTVPTDARSTGAAVPLSDECAKKPRQLPTIAINAVDVRRLEDALIRRRQIARRNFRLGIATGS